MLVEYTGRKQWSGRQVRALQAAALLLDRVPLLPQRLPRLRPRVPQGYIQVIYIYSYIYITRDRPRLRPRVPQGRMPTACTYKYTQLGAVISHAIVYLAFLLNVIGPARERARQRAGPIYTDLTAAEAAADFTPILTAAEAGPLRRSHPEV